MPPLHTPLPPSTKNFNWAGVVGFFGGQEVISAMHSVHLYEGRRWLGWFNSPGGLTVARYFGMIARSRFWDTLFPGPNDSPAIMFGLDGKKGPKYFGAYSATEMETGHLGYLTMERCTQEEEIDIIEGRETIPVGVSYLAMKKVDYGAPVRCLPLKYALCGLIPTIVSVVTCIICALVYDWISSSIILLGIVVSGLANCIIGNGRLVIKSVKVPATGASPGHGILMGENEVVVIKGNGRDVSAITRGRFDIEYEEGKSIQHDKEKNKVSNRTRNTTRAYHEFGLCSLLLAAHFLVQLFAVSQGTPFGQILLLVSLVVSWGYNSYLSSLEKENIQTRLLFQWLGIEKHQMRRFQAGTRTTMAVFVCLLLFHGTQHNPAMDRDRRLSVLSLCIPNDTGAWKMWRDKVIEQTLNVDEPGLPNLEVDEEDWEFQSLPGNRKQLLKVLLDDARTAINKYLSIRADLPEDSDTSRLDALY